MFRFMIAFLTACGIGSTPDPHTLEGALGYAALALERDDGTMLFRVVDARARHALISIVHDRREAADVIRAAYPDDAQQEALASLGDAADAEDAANLFVTRCGETCRAEILGSLGAPRTSERQGDEMHVETARGTLRLYRASDDDWWGIVWKTDELDAERDRASRDLRMITSNAETYRRRQALE